MVLDFNQTGIHKANGIRTEYGLYDFWKRKFDKIKINIGIEKIIPKIIPHKACLILDVQMNLCSHDRHWIMFDVLVKPWDITTNVSWLQLGHGYFISLLIYVQPTLLLKREFTSRLQEVVRIYFSCLYLVKS